MPIDPTRPTDTPRDYDYDPQPTTTPTTTSAPGTTTTPRGPVSPDDAPDPLAGQSHGRSSAEFVRRQQTGSSRTSDGVIYLGMNSTGGQNAQEAERLGKTVRPGTEVDIVGHGEGRGGAGGDKVRVAGPGGKSVVCDLSTTAGVQTFVSSLGVSPESAAAVAQVLDTAEKGGRDELAGLAAVLARGERGEPMPTRLVISGHCYEGNLYDGGNGDKFGDITLTSIQALAKALPTGAAHIEDLMLSACSTGYTGDRAVNGNIALPSWKEAFPNLKTAWGYGGPTNWHSPSGIVAVQHVVDWEKASRGPVEHLPAHAQRVSTWTVADGYRMGTDQ